MQAPYGKDAQFAALREASIGAPILVRTPQGEPSFWLVPLLSGDWACGFATVNLRNNVTRLGIFGSMPKDRAAWVRADFFKAPPEDSLAEIVARYPDSLLLPPVFSYDVSPTKWGWMVSATHAESPPVVIFITPGGWYAQHTTAAGDFEG